MTGQFFHNAGRDAMMILDPNHRILAVNEAIMTATGLSAVELTGRYCYEIFSPRQPSCSTSASAHSCTGGEMYLSDLTPRARQKAFHVSSVPMLEADDKARYTLCIARDIDDAERLEEKLFQTHRMETMGMLAGGIAHDFNNILTAILGFAEITRAKLSMGRPVAGEIDEVIAAARRAADLVGQILRYSRSDDRRKRPLRMDEIVREALKMLRSTLPATIDLQTDISREGTLVLADPTSIHQVVVNLCTNAQRAIGQGKGNLRITLRKVCLPACRIPVSDGIAPGSFIELVIQDNGKGMDKETMARMFEPYFTTREQGEGTGLGLAVTHGIVQEHNGFIKVKSVPGKGSAFHIYLPAMEEEITLSDEQEEESLPGGRERILFVDDEAAIVNFGRSFLESLGYHVYTETDSIVALEKFKDDPAGFDLVITDQTMPGLTGMELARSMLALRADLPIILCTGYSAALSEEDVRLAGIRNFLAKPMDTKILADTVRKLLDGYNALTPVLH